jgi:hypothetical protein
MALTKVSRGLLSTGIVDNSNATAITLNADESATFSGTVGVNIAPTSYKLTVNSGATTETTAAAIGYNGDAGTNLYINTDHGNNLVSLYSSGNVSKEMRFLSGSLEVMRLGTTGKVSIGGVGNISPYGIRFAINGTGSGGAGLYFGSGVILPTDNTPTLSDASVDLGASNYRYKDLFLSGKAHMTGLEPGQVTISSGSYFIGNTAAGYRFNNAADTVNLMILKDSGDLLLGYTTPLVSSKFLVSFDGTSHNAYVARTTRTGINSNFAVFLNSSNQVAGTITHNGSTTVNYSASSDQRLKENIADADDSGSIMDAIQVRKFDWIDGGAHEKYGFIAQELINVVPNAVSSMGMPDEEDPMLGVDPSKLMALAIKEIQMLRARVAQLENN